MSIWTRIVAALGSLAAGEGLGAALARLRTPPERSVAFTIAVIALGAKIAKADGRVTRNEVSVFREIFTIAPRDEAAAARVFNLARQDVAGFETYAAQIAAMFQPGAPVLTDLLEGLFAIAAADGESHAEEEALLRRAADLFGVGEACFRRLRAAWFPEADDPWQVLGLEPGADPDLVRARWRALARESHPDAALARGLPEEAVKLATAQLARINDAYDRILAE